MLQLQGTLISPIEVKPELRVALTAYEGNRATQRVLLHRHDGKPLGAVTAKPADPTVVLVTTEGVTEEMKQEGFTARPGDVWLTLTVPPRTGAVSRSTRIDVETHVPEQPKVQIPVYVRIRSLIAVQPVQVRIVLPSSGGAGTARTIRLTHGMRREFRLLGVECDRPEMFDVSMDEQGKASVHRVTVRLTDELAAASLDSPVRAAVTIRTDDPQRQVIRVPLVVSRRKTAVRPAPGAVTGAPKPAAPGAH